MNKTQKINFILIQLLLCLLLFLKFCEETMLVFVGMQCTILIIRKGHLIKNNLFPGAVWFRRTVYFLPYILFYFLFGSSSRMELTHLVLWFVISILLGAALLLIRKRELTTIYNKEFIIHFSPLNRKEAILESYSCLGSAILQELFFKGFILNLLFNIINPIIAVIITGIFFTEEHILHYYAKNSYESKDYILQFLMSTLSGVIYLYSGSLSISLISHLIFNLSLVFNFWYRVWIHHNIRSEIA